MVGLSDADMKQIRDFAETPRYARTPEQLCETENDQDPEAERTGSP